MEPQNTPATGAPPPASLPQGTNPTVNAHGLDTLVSVNVDTGKLATVIQQLVESIGILNDDVSKIAKARESDNERWRQELQQTNSNWLDAFTKLQQENKAHREDDMNALNAELSAIKDGVDNNFVRLEESMEKKREEDLTLISTEIDNSRAAASGAFDDLCKDVQKNRDGLKLLNEEQLRREGEALQYRKRREEEEARVRDEINTLVTELNGLRQYCDSLDTKIGELRTDAFSQLQRFGSHLDAKADKTTLGENYELILQHIRNGDSESSAQLESLKAQVQQELQQTNHERRILDEEIRSNAQQTRLQQDSMSQLLQQVSHDRDKLKSDVENHYMEVTSTLNRKADMDRVVSLTKHAEQSSEKFAELDKVLDTTTFRLANLEREVITQNKDIHSVGVEVAQLRAYATGSNTATGYLAPRQSYIGQPPTSSTPAPSNEQHDERTSIYTSSLQPPGGSPTTDRDRPPGGPGGGATTPITHIGSYLTPTDMPLPPSSSYMSKMADLLPAGRWKTGQQQGGHQHPHSSLRAGYAGSPLPAAPMLSPGAQGPVPPPATHLTQAQIAQSPR